ncbi:hypothetical protein BDU57DRAFT_241450 [Ampelomyces quisqualis]|uniref:Uncharacterized protein n=1 Tax=Ampelomyces quisqualis TaxID=50730 RepID=A0A6A5QMV4_AMPQU|nr:hypothetical protein BDU57DRAFT_241450 [Ampelomyces quisqualis]
MITWPWDPGYDIEGLDNPFDTGTLHIRVHISSTDRTANKSVEKPDNMYRTDLGHFTHLGSTQYILVGIADKASCEWKGPDAITTHIVLGVRQRADSMYYRESLMEIEQEVWENLEPSTQVI